ncbi:MAG: hypothetical protein K6T75_08775 [Acetobacteraceae bacterium]|nr:hypothetical protein [Acetobacteraceae bacterium]
MRLEFVFPVLLLIVALGVVFDIVGVAVAVAEEAPFHAMAAKRVPGASNAIRLVRNAERVASFCNDIMGDLAGTIAGAASTVVVFRLLALRPQWDEAMLSMLAVALVAALTVGAKAAAKGLAMREANRITLRVGRLLCLLERAVGVSGPALRRRRGRGR